MCAEWHADGRGYFLWQPLLVVLWLCTTFPNIGQPTLYIANPQPCVIFSNISPPLHYFLKHFECGRHVFHVRIHQQFRIHP